MHPFIICLSEQGPCLGSYPVLVAAGMVTAVLISYRAALRAGLNANDFLDLLIVLLLSSWIGAKLVFVIVNHGQFSQKPWEALYVWSEGHVFIGGFLIACIAGIVFCRRRNLDVLSAADVLAPAIALGHGIGRIGCLLGGCCFGAPVKGEWGIRFVPGSLAYETFEGLGLIEKGAASTPPLWPVQPVEAVFLLFMGLGLHFMLKYRKWSGQVFCVYLAAYGTGRFLLELVRGDIFRGFISDGFSWPALNRLLSIPPYLPNIGSTSQVLGLVMVIAGIGLWVRYR